MNLQLENYGPVKSKEGEGGKKIRRDVDKVEFGHPDWLGGKTSCGSTVEEKTKC